MGFTIEDALRETKKRYKMTLLAGEEGCSNAMSWIQMVEDKTILQQLWGKELVVTTGLGFQSQEKLREFIEQLIKYHSVGLVINTGKYIFDIEAKFLSTSMTESGLSNDLKKIVGNNEKSYKNKFEKRINIENDNMNDFLSFCNANNKYNIIHIIIS